MLFLFLYFRIDGEEVRLMLWDTAGQEEFDAITKAYYRGAHACVLAFSTTDRDSFLALHSWKLKVRQCNTLSHCKFVGTYNTSDARIRMQKINKLLSTNLINHLRNPVSDGDKLLLNKYDVFCINK